MAIFRIKKDRENPYVIMNKGFLLNKNLSWKAKGLLSYLLTLPDDWEINIEDLRKRSSSKKEATYSAVSELIKNNYVVRRRETDEKGKIKKFSYDVYEHPYYQTSTPPFPENPEVDNPFPGKPFPGNPAIINNKNDYILKTYILEILETWNHRPRLQTHREEVVEHHIKKRHHEIIKLIGLDEIKKAIINYDLILADPGKFYFSYKWPLWDFLVRGAMKFTDSAEPFNNFKKKTVQKKDGRPSVDDVRREYAK